VYLTYFYHLGYLYAKNYQIWWRFDKVLTKTSWVIFMAHPVLKFTAAADEVQRKMLFSSFAFSDLARQHEGA